MVKTGRPKQENPIRTIRTVRLDPETDKKLQAYCEEHGISRGDAIRQGIHLLLEKG